MLERQRAIRDDARNAKRPRRSHRHDDRRARRAPLHVRGHAPHAIVARRRPRFRHHRRVRDAERLVAKVPRVRQRIAIRVRRRRGESHRVVRRHARRARGERRRGSVIRRERPHIHHHVQARRRGRIFRDGRDVNVALGVGKSATDHDSRVALSVRGIRRRIEQMRTPRAGRPRAPVQEHAALHPSVAREFLPQVHPGIPLGILAHFQRIPQPRIEPRLIHLVNAIRAVLPDAVDEGSRQPVE